SGFIRRRRLNVRFARNRTLQRAPADPAANGSPPPGTLRGKVSNAFALPHAPAVSTASGVVFSRYRCERTARNLFPAPKIFLQKRVSQKGYPFMGEPLVSQNQKNGGIRGGGLEQFSIFEIPPPGGHPGSLSVDAEVPLGWFVCDGPRQSRSAM